MILNIFVFALVACVGCLYGVGGASFSKVYVSSAQETVPLEYIQYGAPAFSLQGPQLAQISAAPIGSMIPVASSPNLIPPCNTPCILTGQALPSVAVASATPNFVTYSSNAPVVVTNNEEPAGYEYSYVVYDENTGDHKAQRESSNGGVVKGEYSLLQPDGYVREVQYTADNLKGFNAIVKKFLPVNVESKEKQPAPPSHETKNEPSESSEEKHEQAHHAEPHVEDKNHKSNESVPSHETKVEEHSPKYQESHELVKAEHPGHTEGAQDKKSEALTLESPVSSEEKVSSEEGSSEENKSEPHHEEHEPKVSPEEQKADEHEVYQINEKSYHDIIKCVQTAINSQGQIQAPLTYIILNKPC